MMRKKIAHRHERKNKSLGLMGAAIQTHEPGRQRPWVERASDVRFHNVVSISTDGIVIVDRAGMIMFVNPAAESLFSRPAQALIGEQFGFPIVAGKTTELDIASRDGKRITAEMRVATTEWEGQPAYLATLRDITERKQAADRLSEVLRQQQAILDNIPTVAWLKDRSGRYIAVNDAFGKEFGQSTQELVGKRAYDIFPPERAEKYEEECQEVITTGSRKYFEESIVDPQGTTQYIEKIVTPIFDDDGEVVGITGIVHDITNSKEIEQKLRYASTHDILTGLYNRAFFDAELERLGHSRMFPISIVMADVNGLKKINDTEGHDAGDKLIKLAARIILAAFRAEDIVARIGGDEFSVLLPATVTSVAEEAIARILGCPEIVSGQVSIAFGIASAANQDELAAALKLSDQLMYQNKAAQKARLMKGNGYTRNYEAILKREGNEQ